MAKATCGSRFNVKEEHDCVIIDGFFRRARCKHDEQTNKEMSWSKG